MTTLEDRLRQDLPALADLLMEDQATQPQEAVQPEEAVGAIAGGPFLVVEFGARPAHRRRRWPAVVAAAAAVAVAAVAGIVALVITTSDRTEVTTTEVPAAQPDAEAQDGASEPETPATEVGDPETPSDRIDFPNGEPETPADQTHAPNGQPQFRDEPRDGEEEAPTEAPAGQATTHGSQPLAKPPADSVMPGSGSTTRFSRLHATNRWSRASYGVMGTGFAATSRSRH